MARSVLLSLRLLGGFQATRAADGSPVEFSNRKVAQLTAYLALNPGKRQDRAQVARAIWPGVGQESALSSLRNALALLRKDLDGQGLPSDEILLADRVSACLVAVATDLQGLLEARAADAARLYQGPLLPEWDGDWIAEARAKARAHVRRESEGLGVEDLVAVHDRDREFEPLLQAAAAALLADGRPTEAVEICRGFARSLRQRTGMLPSEARLQPVVEAAGLSWDAVERFGVDYADTLSRWDQRFQAAWGDIRKMGGFDERFRRLWRFYLAYCEAGFRSRRTDVIQLALARA